MNPSVDVSAEIQHLKANRKLRCSTPVFEPGGGGINVSRALHHLGTESLALFPSGGKGVPRLETMLQNEGVRSDSVPVQQPSRQNLTLSETDTDEQYRFVFPGHKLDDNEWKQCLARVEEIQPAPEILVASGSLPPGVPEDFYARLSRIARKRQIRLAVDSKGGALSGIIKEGCSFIKPNMAELREIAGTDQNNDDRPVETACGWVRKGKFEFIVISLGAGGAVLVTREGAARYHAPHVPIESRVGAGDSMMAGIIFGLTRQWPVQQSLLYGLAAGSAAVTTPGSELCRREDTENLYQKLKKK